MYYGVNMMLKLEDEFKRIYTALFIYLYNVKQLIPFIQHVFVIHFFQGWINCTSAQKINLRNSIKIIKNYSKCEILS